MLRGVYRYMVGNECLRHEIFRFSLIPVSSQRLKVDLIAESDDLTFQLRRFPPTLLYLIEFESKIGM